MTNPILSQRWCALVAIAGFLSGPCLVGCGSPTEASSTPPSTEPARPELDGHWASKGCSPAPQEDGTTLYLTRAFEFADNAWALVLTTHIDAACSEPLLHIDVSGTYAITGQSPSVADAFEARFDRAVVRATAKARDAKTLLTDAHCGTEPWQVDRAQSVANGCLFLPSIADCPAEYDLVRQRGDQLWFGVRRGSLCVEAGRPGALDEHAMLRGKTP